MTSKILIVDDDRLLCALIEAILMRKQNFEVSSVNSGYEALDFLKKETPDLILLDVMMPGIDGLEVIRRIRSDEKTFDIPVIFLTARADQDTREMATSAGANGYLSKPVKPDHLLSCINDVLDSY